MAVQTAEPTQTYIVAGVLRVGYLEEEPDGSIKRDKEGRPIARVREFQPGEEFHSTDISKQSEPGELERLIASGALKFPSQVLAPEDVNARLARLEQLEAENAVLKAAQAAGAGGGQWTADRLEENEAQIEEAKVTAARQPKASR